GTFRRHDGLQLCRVKCQRTSLVPPFAQELCGFVLQPQLLLECRITLDLLRGVHSVGPTGQTSVGTDSLMAFWPVPPHRSVGPTGQTSVRTDSLMVIWPVPPHRSRLLLQPGGDGVVGELCLVLNDGGIERGLDNRSVFRNQHFDNNGEPLL